MRNPSSLFACLCCTLAAVSGANADPITITPIGPGPASFQIVDYSIFTAPIGTSADSYAEFYKILPSVLPEPFYKYYPTQNNMGPGSQVNPGPYTHDISNGLAALGWANKTNFQPSDFSNGNGIYDAFMLIPTAGGATGSSADSTNGPIIPNSVFPLTESGTLWRNGVLYDPNNPSPFKLPALDANFDPQFAGLDGWSHFVIDGGESSDFGPAGTPIDGHYTFDITLVDKNGNGYDVKGGYNVADPTASPEPTGLTLGGMALVGAFGYGWKRRKAARTYVA